MADLKELKEDITSDLRELKQDMTQNQKELKEDMKTLSRIINPDLKELKDDVKKLSVIINSNSDLKKPKEDMNQDQRVLKESLNSDYIKVFSHNVSGGLWTDHEEVGSKNVDNPDAKLYSILNKLENYRNKEGKFKFKLRYPELTWGINGSNCNEWFQTSNPYTHGYNWL